MIMSAQRTFESIINGQIRIFESCAKFAKIEISGSIGEFEELYEKCSKIADGDSPATESPVVETTVMYT